MWGELVEGEKVILVINRVFDFAQTDKLPPFSTSFQCHAERRRSVLMSLRLRSD